MGYTTGILIRRKFGFRVLSLVAFLIISYVVVAQEKTVNIQGTISLENAFKQIENQTGYSIAYQQSKVDIRKNISVALKNESLDKALTEVLKDTGLSYKINGYHVILIPKQEKQINNAKEGKASQIPKIATVSGRITDAQTGEALIGCTIFEGKTNQGTTTNASGLYSLTLSCGSSKLTYSYIGYKNINLDFDLRKDTTINVFLYPQSEDLEEVIVKAENRNLQTARLGNINVPLSLIKNTPALMGESDLMKSLQFIPGVQNAAEGKSDLSVRGGSPDQNLILLDGIPIYNANHVFGFLSIFNTDALKNVTLYKSGFPARFGGRLSSVIDINTKEGNKDKFTGSATLGLLAAKFNLEGPIIKDRTSFTFSARRSFMDLFLNNMQDWMNDESSNNDRTNFFFYDVNAKIHHKASDKLSFYAMVYNGRDKLKNTYGENTGSGIQTNSVTEQDWAWGNTIAAVKMNYVLSPQLFLNTTLSYNQYRYNTTIDKNYTSTSEEEIKSNDNLNYSSGIRDYSANIDLEHIPSSKHYLRYGLSATFHDFRPEVVSQSSNTENITPSSKSTYAKEFSLYAEDDWDITRKLRLNGGFRFSMFNVNNTTYHAIDPRFALRYLLTDNLSLKAGYTHMQQYIHLLSNNSLLLQTDLWVPVTDKVKPMNSQQMSVGAYYALPKLFDISVEAYYKNMENVIEYKDGASFSGISLGWESKVEAGIGKSYGIEFSVEKKEGRTTGILSYALAKTERKFNEINYGEWFPAKFDRRHVVNISLNHKFSKKIDVSLNWVYSSGNMVTIPMMSLIIPDIPDDRGKVLPVEQLDHRNNYRMPSYHRLDLGMNYTFRKKGSRYGVLNISIYNAYNRMNPFKIFVEEDSDRDSNGRTIYVRKLKQITLFPIIPSISYTYHF